MHGTFPRCAGDAHFKVATAALEALAEGLAGRNAKLFEPQLDRLMPALFLRCVRGENAGGMGALLLVTLRIEQKMPEK